MWGEVVTRLLALVRAPRIERRPRAVVDDTIDRRFLVHDPDVSRVLRMDKAGQRARAVSRYA
jgi:hypothetical protein